MDDRHYILGEIYTYDLDYWNRLLKADFVCENDMVANKLFVNQSPIDEISTTEFINLTQNYCTIIDGRPEDPISNTKRYDIIKDCIQKPGFTYIRKPFDPLSELKMDVVYPPKNEEANDKCFKAVAGIFGSQITEGCEFIFSKKVPKDIQAKFIDARLRLFFSSPGGDNFLSITREFIEIFTASIKVIDPSFDMSEIADRFYANALLRHKEALRGQLSKLNRLLKKRKREHKSREVILTEQKIAQISKQLESNCPQEVVSS